MKVKKYKLQEKQAKIYLRQDESRDESDISLLPDESPTYKLP